MAEKTKILWCDSTFNPWIGCTKVSPGCANCYAENTTRARVLRSHGHETWGKGAKRSRTSAATWRNPVKWNRAAQACGTRLRAFPSLCDVLDDEVSIELLADFLRLIHETPNIDWLLLTKRPQNFFPQVLTAGMHLMGYRDGQSSSAPSAEATASFETIESVLGWAKGETHPANVWLGVSVEDQKRADERIPLLVKIPAAIRFLSVEPMLGPIDLHYSSFNGADSLGKMPGIDWAIFGGESGPKARPCDIDWIRSGVNQCRKAGVAPFIKQLGSDPVMLPGPMSWPCEDPKGGDIGEWPEDLRVREFPTRQTSELLAYERRA